VTTQKQPPHELRAAESALQQAREAANLAAVRLRRALSCGEVSRDLAAREREFNLAVDWVREMAALVEFWRGVRDGKVDLG
jgi:hypothetical protein